MRFKVNDRVCLISKVFPDSPVNPAWGGSQGHVVGTVTSIRGSLENPICVTWDNGTNNVYPEVKLNYFNPDYTIKSVKNPKKFRVKFKFPMDDTEHSKVVGKSRSKASTVKFLKKKYGFLIDITNIEDITPEFPNQKKDRYGILWGTL